MGAMPRLSRPLTSLFVLAVSIGSLAALAGCGGEPPIRRSDDTVATSAPAVGAPTVTNVFLPEGQNVTDCVGTLERPDCGSSSKGGWQMYLTFGVLIAGLSVIGWRVVAGIRRRDAVVNRIAEPVVTTEQRAD